MTRHRSTRCFAGALVACAILLTACNDDSAASAPPDEDSSPPSSPADGSGGGVKATPLADLDPGTTLTPGLYAMSFPTEQPDAPMVLIDVPAGYSGGGDPHEIASEEVGFRHFGTWTAAEVAVRPCEATDWVDPGPSVDDLADALAELPIWESTQPVPRTIGGHEGVFMELNVPAHIPAKCQGELLSWRDHSGGTQGIAPGKIQRLWIVDVDGHRLMLIAGYFPAPDSPTPGQIEEMTRMAEGARFVAEEQVAP